MPESRRKFRLLEDLPGLGLQNESVVVCDYGEGERLFRIQEVDPTRINLLWDCLSRGVVLEIGNTNLAPRSFLTRPRMEIVR